LETRERGEDRASRILDDEAAAPDNWRRFPGPDNAGRAPFDGGSLLRVLKAEAAGQRP